MGRTVDKQHVHFLDGISICTLYLSHKSINKNQICVEFSLPCIVRYTRVITHKSPSIFIKIGEKKTMQNRREKKKSVQSIIQHSS